MDGRKEWKFAYLWPTAVTCSSRFGNLQVKNGPTIFVSYEFHETSIEYLPYGWSHKVLKGREALAIVNNTGIHTVEIMFGDLLLGSNLPEENIPVASTNELLDADLVEV